MKKLSIKGVMNSVQSAAVDGAILYAGMTAAQIVNTQLGKVLPTTFVGPLRAIVVASAGIVAADALLPKRYAGLVGAAMAAEVVASFAAPVVTPMLISSGLISGAAPAPAAAGYMRGYASMRGGMGLWPEKNAFGLEG